MPKSQKRRALWYFFLAPFAFLGFVTAEVSDEEMKRHPRAKWLGILIVPAVFAAVAVFFWGRSEGVWEDLGLTSPRYDVSESGACHGLSAQFATRNSSATSDVIFYKSGRTELRVDHLAGVSGVGLELVMQADSSVTPDDDMVSRVRFARLHWYPGQDEISDGLLGDDAFWNRPKPPLRDVSKLLGREMTAADFEGDKVRIGAVEINKGEIWLAVPVAIWRSASAGSYNFDIRGTIPDSEIADAINLFSSSDNATAWLRVKRGDSAQVVTKRQISSAGQGTVMPEAVDAMLAQWIIGIPNDC